jgi:hypothetical protein
MNYTDALVIDSFAYNKRENTNIESYKLNNFDYYEPKLIDDFYLKYFTKVLLFEIDILELEDFIFFHFLNCENPDKYIKILELKIVTKIDEIVSNAIFTLDSDDGVKKIKLDAGLVEYDGVIYHPQHEDSFFYYITALKKLQKDLEKRKLMITDYTSKLKSSNSIDNLEVLKWKGKPSHLAFIIRSLIDQGFIEEPKLNSNEINLTDASRRIINSFSFDSPQSSNTFRTYLNVNTDRHKKLKKKFEDLGFNIPTSGFLG